MVVLLHYAIKLFTTKTRKDENKKKKISCLFFVNFFILKTERGYMPGTVSTKKAVSYRETAGSASDNNLIFVSLRWNYPDQVQRV